MAPSNPSNLPPGIIELAATPECVAYFVDALQHGPSINRLVAKKIAGDIRSKLTVLAPEGCQQLPKECHHGGILGHHSLTSQDMLEALHRQLICMGQTASSTVCVIEDLLAAPEDAFLEHFPWRIYRGSQVFHVVPLAEVHKETTAAALRRLSRYPPGLGLLSKLHRRWSKHPELTSADEEEISEGLILAFTPVFDGETYLLYRP